MTIRAADGEDFEPEILHAAITKARAYHLLTTGPVTVQTHDLETPGTCECGKPWSRCDVVKALVELRHDGLPALET